jgi:hypothetical protein
VQFSSGIVELEKARRKRGLDGGVNSWNAADSEIAISRTPSIRRTVSLPNAALVLTSRGKLPTGSDPPRTAARWVEERVVVVYVIRVIQIGIVRPIVTSIVGPNVWRSQQAPRVVSSKEVRTPIRVAKRTLWHRFVEAGRTQFCRPSRMPHLEG